VRIVPVPHRSYLLKNHILRRPPPLNSHRITFLQKTPGGGAHSPPSSCPVFSSARNLFRINTYKTDTKQTTSSSFRINTYEKHRRGSHLLLTKNRIHNSQTERQPERGLRELQPVTGESQRLTNRALEKIMFSSLRKGLR
jgi:hypothetical protein